MLKTIAIIFGVLFVIVGILGFVPAAAPGGKLLGIFSVNALHNLVHLLTGIIAIICGLSSHKASRIFFAVFGIIYAIVTILGFVQGDGLILNSIANNMADNWLHLVIAIIALYLGFGCCCKCETPVK